jgi:hypothetical protein
MNLNGIVVYIEKEIAATFSSHENISLYNLRGSSSVFFLAKNMLILVIGARLCARRKQR